MGDAVANGNARCAFVFYTAKNNSTTADTTIALSLNNCLDCNEW